MMRRTTSQLRAEQIAALQAQQAEYDKRIQDASKLASHARCALVEDLYELFGIEAEQRVRQGRSGAFPVSTDRDESRRTAKLLDAVSQLLERQASTEGSRSDAGDFGGANVGEGYVERSFAEA